MNGSLGPGLLLLLYDMLDMSGGKIVLSGKLFVIESVEFLLDFAVPTHSDHGFHLC